MAQCLPTLNRICTRGILSDPYPNEFDNFKQTPLLFRIMVTTMHFEEESSLGYESTQTHIPSKTRWLARWCDAIAYPFTSECWIGIGHALCGGSALEEESERINYIVANIVEYNVGTVPEEVMVANAIHDKEDRSKYLRHQYETMHKPRNAPLPDPKAIRPPGLFPWAHHQETVTTEIDSVLLQHGQPVRPELIKQYRERRDLDFEVATGLCSADIEKFVKDHLLRGRRPWAVLASLLKHEIPLEFLPGPDDLPEDVRVLTPPQSCDFDVVDGKVIPKPPATSAGYGLTRRVIHPSLVGALVLDARARWGLRPQTLANRDMVGHHMRKQCKNSALHVSIVDTHVSLALVEYFVPNGVDIMSRRMELDARNADRRREFETIGMSWWKKWVYSSPSIRDPVA